MTDTFMVVWNNGEEHYLNRAACFAPLQNYRKRLEYEGGKVDQLTANGAKPHYITYTIGCDDTEVMERWVNLFNRIGPFKDIIANCTYQNHVGSITVYCDKPAGAMVYTLAAFRLLQEYPGDRKWVKTLLNNRYLREEHPALLYLILESMKFGDDGLKIMARLGHRGHANDQPDMHNKTAYAFDQSVKGFKTNGEKEDFSECCTNGIGWGSLPDKGIDADEFFDILAQRVNKGIDSGLCLNDSINKEVKLFFENKGKWEIKRVKAGPAVNKVKPAVKPKKKKPAGKKRAKVNKPEYHIVNALDAIARHANRRPAPPFPAELRPLAAVVTPSTVKHGRRELTHESWLKLLARKKDKDAHRQLYAKGYRCGFHVRASKPNLPF